MNATNAVTLTFGDQQVLVSVVTVAGTEKTSADDRVRNKAIDALERASAVIDGLARSGASLAKNLGRAATSPTQLELELGIAFSINGDVIIAGAGVEASVAVHLHYDITPSRNE